MNKSSNKKSMHNSMWLIIGIIVFVFIFLAVMLIAQKGFSHKIKQISFTLSNGLASSEEQQTLALTITPTSCTITVTKPQQQTGDTKSCPMNEETFNKVRLSTDSYSVIDKIIANSDTEELVGGKKATISIELQNGTVFSTVVTPKFYNDLGPYFEEIELLVPSLSQLLPSQSSL
jgi:hypothetical protein